MSLEELFGLWCDGIVLLQERPKSPELQQSLGVVRELVVAKLIFLWDAKGRTLSEKEICDEALSLVITFHERIHALKN